MSLSQVAEFFASASKVKDLEDAEKELEDRKRLLVAAQNDLRDARVEAARLKAEADIYAAEKRNEAKDALDKLRSDLAAEREGHRIRLRNMEDNAADAVAVLERALTETQKTLAATKEELAHWLKKLGYVKSAFEDAHKVVAAVEETGDEN